MVYSRKIIIADILKNRGIKQGYAGFACLVSAIDYIIENDLVFKKIYVTKEIYPAVAEDMGVSINSVERNIRSAIERSDIYMSNGAFIKELAFDCYVAVSELYKAVR